MFYDASPGTQDFIDNFDSHFGEGAFKLLGIYMKLDPFDRGRVVGNMEEMLTDDKYLQVHNNEGSE